MCQEILAALEDAENEEVKFIILSAEGKIFSVGGDLSEMNAQSMWMTSALVLIAELVNTLKKIKQLPKAGYYGGRWSGRAEQLLTLQ